MRGSIFYDTSRGAALETSKTFAKHKEHLESITSRQTSRMRKAFKD